MLVYLEDTCCADSIYGPWAHGPSMDSTRTCGQRTHVSCLVSAMHRDVRSFGQAHNQHEDDSGE